MTTAMMECPCGMRGPGTDTDGRFGSSRERHFETTSKDNADVRHTSTFTFDDEQGRMTGTCHGAG